MRIFFILLVLCCVSCSSFQRSNGAKIYAGSEKSDVMQLQNLLKDGEYNKAVEVAEAFQSRYPHSTELQKVRFLKANALEELERWNEAAETYRLISEFSEKNQPEISALSVYRLSFVYEALGEDERVLTSLLQAKKYDRYLPSEVTLAEIPSRIAMVYAKENNAKEAQKWLKEADRGLQKVLESRHQPLTEEWLAKSYYNMGSISTSQLSRDNILTIIQGQAAVQKYLIRSMQYGNAHWSAKALKKLQTTYKDIWHAIENYPEPAGMETLVAQKVKKDEQFRLAGPFSELIKDAQLYRPFHGQKINTYQEQFFDFLNQVQDRVSVLFQNPIYTPLTSE